MYRARRRQPDTISHHRTDTAITFLVTAVTAKARLRNCLDGFLDRAPRGAARGESPVERGRHGGDHRDKIISRQWV